MKAWRLSIAVFWLNSAGHRNLLSQSSQSLDRTWPLDGYLDKYSRMEECQKKNIMICKGCNAVLFGISKSAMEEDGYQAHCFDSGSFIKNARVRLVI